MSDTNNNVEVNKGETNDDGAVKEPVKKIDPELDAQMEAAIASAKNTAPVRNAKKQASTSAVINPIVRYPATDYFKNGTWDNERAFLKQPQLKTLFENMDALQPLYGGVYVYGAVPGLGKTTFVHQMADQIASQKTPVLFFSFEQTANELYAKSLSRRTYYKSKIDNHCRAYTALEIRRGMADGTAELAYAIDSYTTSVENYMSILECNFDTTVEVIEQIVDQEVMTAKKAGLPVPVVVIDYLQVIHASTVDGRLITDSRMSVDHIIKVLKQLQKRHKLVLIIISNLNRMNYMTAVDMESFKESGGIEYTTDFLGGFCYSITTDDDFEHKVFKSGGQKDRTASEKRILIGRAKNAAVRDIELRILKNRFGVPGGSLYFEYNPKYDTIMASTHDRYLDHKRRFRLMGQDTALTSTKDAQLLQLSDVDNHIESDIIVEKNPEQIDPVNESKETGDDMIKIID